MTVSDRDCHAPLRAAVTTTDSSAGGVMLAAAIEKVAVVAEAGTVTELGGTNAVPPTETGTVTPPAGAASDRLIAQLLFEPALMLIGLHVSAVTISDDTRLRLVLWEDPFSEAVTVAFCVLVRVPAMAAKVATVPPEGTVMAAGRVSAALLLEREIVAPEKGAGSFSVAVHVDERTRKNRCRIAGQGRQSEGGHAYYTPRRW